MKLFEQTLKLKGFPIKKAKLELKKIQRLSDDEFIALQNKQKWEVAKYHFKNTPFYAQKVGSVFPDLWDDLPILTKKDFQLPIGQMISKEYLLKDLYVANTSGSSGHPFYYAKDKFSHALTWAHVDFLYHLHHLSYQSKQARFYGIPMEKKGYYIEKIKDALSNRVRFPVFDLSDDVLYKYYLSFSKTSFESIYGYTSSIVYFCRYLISHNYCLKTICPSLKKVITTSELLTPDDRKIIEQATGVKVVNEYGASELGIIGFEDQQFNLRLSEELIYAEINNPTNSDHDKISGELLTTSLYNKAMPIIKYQIGDVATLTKNYIGKYRNILSLDGRVNDFAKLPSGKTAPGLTFYYISRSILESSGSLKEFIIRQTSIDTFEFDVVSDTEITDQQKQEILSKMELYLEPNLKLVINNVSRIERPNSGKIKHFYNQLK